MSSTTVAEPIPLTRLNSSPAEDGHEPESDAAGDDAAPTTTAAVQNDQGTATTTTTTTVSASQDRAVDTPAPPRPAPVRRVSRVQSFARGAGVTNSLGTLALVAAVVFGIGAWVGMKIQISQGGKNMDLAIWTACADHETIQKTALCKSILAKDFSSQFEKREGVSAAVETKLGKRDLTEGDFAVPGIEAEDIKLIEKSESAKKSPDTSRYDKLLSGMSSADMAFVHTGHQGHVEPALHATFLPVVNLLMKPVTALFEFVEYMFLVVIYFVHKIFSWTARAFM